MPWCHPLQWHHNGHDSVSNHQLHGCLLIRLFRRRSKKTSKPHVTGLCVGNSPGTNEFPAQMASNAEIFSIWWRHHWWTPEFILSTTNIGKYKTAWMWIAMIHCCLQTYNYQHETFPGNLTVFQTPVTICSCFPRPQIWREFSMSCWCIFMKQGIRE